jgi:hypothetical protein
VPGFVWVVSTYLANKRPISRTDLLIEMKYLYVHSGDNCPRSFTEHPFEAKHVYRCRNLVPPKRQEISLLRPTGKIDAPIEVASVIARVPKWN